MESQTKKSEKLIATAGNIDLILLEDFLYGGIIDKGHSKIGDANRIRLITGNDKFKAWLMKVAELKIFLNIKNIQEG